MAVYYVTENTFIKIAVYHPNTRNQLPRLWAPSATSTPDSKPGCGANAGASWGTKPSAVERRWRWKWLQDGGKRTLSTLGGRQLDWMPPTKLLAENDERSDRTLRGGATRGDLIQSVHHSRLDSVTDRSDCPWIHSSPKSPTKGDWVSPRRLVTTDDTGFWAPFAACAAMGSDTWRVGLENSRASPVDGQKCVVPVFSSMRVKRKNDLFERCVSGGFT